MVCVCTYGNLGRDMWTECQIKDLRFYSAGDGEQNRFSSRNSDSLRAESTILFTSTINSWLPSVLLI